MVADFDGDGEPEIGVQRITEYTLFDSDGSELWRVPVPDNSDFTGSVGFDFDADGEIARSWPRSERRGRAPRAHLTLACPGG